MLREVDVESGDRGFEYGPGVRLEGELSLERARDRRREDDLLLRLGQRPHRREGGVFVLVLHPGQGEACRLYEHALARTPGGKILVARPRRRPVGGLLEDDVEGARHVVIGERGPGELEEREVEGRLEVPRQVRLDERRTDGAEVVGESDPDPRLLADLRARVGRRRERRVHAARAGAVRLARVRALGHVLGPHEALDDL